MTLLSCAEKAEHIRIAAPDDFGGLLSHYLMQEKKLLCITMTTELFPLMDCCSTTAEWAMSSNRVDVAWLCPDAASTLIEKDKRFEILGPALINSQILVIRQDNTPRRIAYSHKRAYQKALIRHRFGPYCEAIPVMPAALPYLYEKGNVDGVIIDVLKGLVLKGNYLPLSGNGAEVTTYVLVIRKAFRKSALFLRVIEMLKAGAGELNDIAVATKLLGKEKGLTPQQVRQILSLGVRFAPPKMQ